MYSGRCATASEALQLFAQRRTLNQKVRVCVHVRESSRTMALAPVESDA